MTNAQLTFGLVSGETKADPFAVGDVIVKSSGDRYVIEVVDSNNAGGVFVCLNLKTGAQAVVLEREIAYRSR